MDMELKTKLEQAVWIAHSLFERGKTSGSTANISFKHEGTIYISASGTCFGTLKTNEFAVVDEEGISLNGLRPSKELTLHRSCYDKSEDIQAVIHTHGPYATLWSCRRFEREDDVIPNYTPYLRMKVGTVGLIPYATPGSSELFRAFQERVRQSDAYLLKNHGAVVGGKSLMDAFFGIEELEESARIACEICKTAQYDLIS